MKKFLISAVMMLAVFALSAQTTNDQKAKEILQNVEMLNYVTTLSRRIQIAKTDRLELSNIRDEIYNNTVSTVIDLPTQEKLTDFQDSIVKYTLISRQRERLEYIAEQEKAQALKNAIPNPIYVLSLINSKDLLQSVISIVSATASSMISYASEKNAVELEYLKENWKLSDEEYIEFERQSKNTYSHMMNIARKYKIPDENILREEAIIKFAELQEDANLQRRINDLENGVNTRLYKNAQYGPYYLLLADSYYDRAQEYIKETPEAKTDSTILNNYYTQCLKNYDAYISRDIKIFKKDFDLIQLLPKVIYAARQIYDDRKYTHFASECLKLIEEQTFEKNWEVRYFAATVYIELGEINKWARDRYFAKAAELLYTNISYLSKQQEKLMLAYVSPIDETINPGTKKSDRKVASAMIKAEKKNRKTQLPPMSDALIINSQLLNWLKDELSSVNQNWEKNYIKPANDAVWNYQLRKKLDLPTTLSEEEKTEDAPSYSRNIPFYLVFDDDKCNQLKLPVTFLSQDTVIKIKAEGNGLDTIVIEGTPKIEAVKRDKPLKKPDMVQTHDYISKCCAILNIKTFSNGLELKKFEKVTVTITSFGESFTRTYHNTELSAFNSILEKIPFVNFNQFNPED